MSFITKMFGGFPDVATVMEGWQDRPIFKGKNDDADAWLAKFKDGCKERNLDQSQWVEAAGFCMKDEPKSQLEEVRTTMLQLNVPGFAWNWRTYKHAVEHMPWKTDRNLKLDLQFLSQLRGLFTKSEKSKPAPQPEPQATTKEDPSTAQYALSFVPGLGFWLPDLLDSTPPPPAEPATPAKTGKGKDKKDKAKGATTESTKKKDTAKPSVSSKEPAKKQETVKKQETTKPSEATKDAGGSVRSKARALIFRNQKSPSELREAALAILWGPGSSAEARKKAVQDLLNTLEKWLVAVCMALLEFYDAIQPLWGTIEGALHLGSSSSLPLPYKEFVTAAYMLMAGTREKIESIRPGPQRRVTL